MRACARLMLASWLGLLACAGGAAAQRGYNPGGATWRPPGAQAPQPPPADDGYGGGNDAPETLPPMDDDALPPMDDGTLPPMDDDTLPPMEGEEDGEDDAESDAKLGVQVQAGLGYGQHSFSLPLPGGERKLDAGGFAATAIGLTLRKDRPSHTSPALRVMYRSSIGYDLQEPVPGGGVASSAARVHELSVDIGARIPLSDAELPAELVIDGGYHFEDLRIDRELRTEPYGLSGPHVRGGFWWPMGDAVSLGVAVDAAWLPAMDTPAQAMGLDGGFLLAADAQLGVAIGGPYWIQLAYREVYTSVALSNGSGNGLTDGRRFITVGVEVQYR